MVERGTFRHQTIALVERREEEPAKVGEEIRRIWMLEENLRKDGQ